MFHCNKSLVCCLIFGITPLVNADVEIKPETDNHPGPYRPWSSEIKQVNPEDLYGITADKLAKMSLNDPLLKFAYIDVFLSALGGLDNSQPEQALALADMRRRGESVSPMLLKLAMENQETAFEITLLHFIDQVGTVNLDPYLEYARNLLRERTQTMNSTGAESASMLLAKHGTKEDIELLEWVIEQRSYVARGVSESLKVLQARLDKTKPKTRPVRRDRSPTSGASTDVAADGSKGRSVANGGDKASTTHWIAWVLLGIVLIGILWLLLRKGIKQGR